jgi:glutamate/aspartate transport system substrate-binding protein
MNRIPFVIAAIALLAAGGAQAADTLAKIKAAGAATMGVRESSGALSYTLGDGKYAASTSRSARRCWPTCRRSWAWPSWTSSTSR